MWTCPDCGRVFSRNKQSHSCEENDLGAFFIGKPESTRQLFDHLINNLNMFGSIEVWVGKYNITLRRITTFATVIVEKNHLTIVFISLDPVDEFPVYQNHHHSANRWSNAVKIESKSEIDKQLLNWLKGAYDLAL